MCMSVHPCECRYFGVQKRTYDLLELELQAIWHGKSFEMLLGTPCKLVLLLLMKGKHLSSQSLWWGFLYIWEESLEAAARPSWIVLGRIRDAGSIWKSQEAALESAESGLTGQGRKRFPWAALRTWGKWDEEKEYASLGFWVIFTFMGTQNFLLTPQKDFL